MAKYGMYPQPVYHATLDDGRTVRMTVWQKENAPEKGFDWEACRRTILNLSSGAGYEAAFIMGADARINTYLDDCYRTSGPCTFIQPKSNINAGRRIIAAHLEQEGRILADDPLAEAKPKRARNNNAAILAALKAYMQGKPEARELAEMALAA